jgi:catechol 2,3-dioxygenase-like lactoylglutathione lyase family enzyme
MKHYQGVNSSMAVSNPDAVIDVTFMLGEERFTTRAKRGQIVHEAFPVALPETLTVGHRLTFSTTGGDEVFADNFLGDLEDAYGAVELVTTALPIPGAVGPWQTIGFDHLAIAVANRPDARDFFRDVVGMKVMRDDAHLTVMATGPTALFLFDTGIDAPLSTSQASRWHHIGFVVDNLEHAYAHLREHKARLSSDFTLLERDERWSLYFFYTNGDVRFMIQFSEVKEKERGYTSDVSRQWAGYLYDYASRPYGLVFGEPK